MCIGAKLTIFGVKMLALEKIEWHVDKKNGIGAKRAKEQKR